MGSRVYKILVVEDEEMVRSNIIQFLDSEGYELEEAESGIEAIQKLDKFFPDLIISDIMMPGMDGYELVKQIQTNPITASIPIILLTARAERQDVRRGMEFGADDYITKPFKAYDLIEAVKIRLQKKENYDRKFEELKSNISLYIPHELRTPLVSIIGFADLLTTSLDDLDQDEIREMASKVKNSSLRLYDRIEKFIFFSELELKKSGEQTPTNFNLNEPFVTSLLKTQFKEKDTSTVKVSIEEAEIQISEEYFGRILIELIDNAFKFTNNESKISVAGYNSEDNYTLIVEDNGRGMDKNEIQQIEAFKQFNREDFQQEGNGLGLAIINDILDIVGGKLEIKSTKNESTKCCVYLKKVPQ